MVEGEGRATFLGAPQTSGCVQITRALVKTQILIPGV